MTASILLAALVGGVVFVLLDSWQRRAEATPERHTEPNWHPEPVVRQSSRAPNPIWERPRHGCATATSSGAAGPLVRLGAADPLGPSSGRMADSGDVASRVAA